MKCPTCAKYGIVRNDYDVTVYPTYTLYAFHCGHFRHLRNVQKLADILTKEKGGE